MFRYRPKLTEIRLKIVNLQYLPKYYSNHVAKWQPFKTQTKIKWSKCLN